MHFLAENPRKSFPIHPYREVGWNSELCECQPSNVCPTLAIQCEGERLIHFTPWSYSSYRIRYAFHDVSHSLYTQTLAMVNVYMGILYIYWRLSRVRVEVFFFVLLDSKWIPNRRLYTGVISRCTQFKDRSHSRGALKKYFCDASWGVVGTPQLWVLSKKPSLYNLTIHFTVDLPLWFYPPSELPLYNKLWYFILFTPAIHADIFLEHPIDFSNLT